MIQTATEAAVVLGLLYLGGTILLSRRKQRIPTTGAEPEVFVFVVPALNEEAVIGSTVRHLLAACANRGLVAVIDDGSSDATAEIVESIDDRRVLLIRRRLPQARLGKGRALNRAYREIRYRLAAQGYSPERTVLAIVDADGRIQPDTLEHVAPYFRDPRVGAVQLLVRIRNRAQWLCRFQDYEFLVFSSLTQTAREHVGSVGLGGNGQFTRLSALIELGAEPWTECLTEDLDLGVRLAVNGWKNRFCGETFVDQQGLPSIRALLRQRTRWAHGHLQCWRLIPRILSSELPTLTVLDLSYYLLAPALVLATSVVYSVAFVWIGISLATSPDTWLSPFGVVFGILMYLFSFGPAIYLAFVYRRRSEELSVGRTFLFGHFLAAYNFIWYLAEWNAVARILGRRGGWAKTARVTEAAAA